MKPFIFVVATVATAALMVPGATAAQRVVPQAKSSSRICGCLVLFGMEFKAHTLVRRKFNQKWNHVLHPPLLNHRAAKQKVKNEIYDWAKDKSFTPSWCERNKKLCNAIKACAVGVATAYTEGLAEGWTLGHMARQMAINCASLAAGVYVVT